MADTSLPAAPTPTSAPRTRSRYSSTSRRPTNPIGHPRQHAQPGLHASRSPGHGDGREHDEQPVLPGAPCYDSDTGNGRLDEYDYPLIPTVVGTYTFHIFGTINGRPSQPDNYVRPDDVQLHRRFERRPSSRWPYRQPRPVATKVERRKPARGECAGERTVRSQQRPATRRRARQGQQHSRSSRSSWRCSSAHSIWR